MSAKRDRAWKEQMVALACAMLNPRILTGIGIEEYKVISDARHLARAFLESANAIRHLEPLSAKYLDILTPKRFDSHKIDWTSLYREVAADITAEDERHKREAEVVRKNRRVSRRNK